MKKLVSLLAAMALGLFLAPAAFAQGAGGTEDQGSGSPGGGMNEGTSPGTGSYNNAPGSANPNNGLSPNNQPGTGTGSGQMNQPPGETNQPPGQMNQPPGSTTQPGTGASPNGTTQPGGSNY